MIHFTTHWDSDERAKQETEGLKEPAWWRSVVYMSRAPPPFLWIPPTPPLTLPPAPARRGCSRTPWFASSAEWFRCRWSWCCRSPAAARGWSRMLCPHIPVITRKVTWHSAFSVWITLKLVNRSCLCSSRQGRAPKTYCSNKASYKWG